MSDSCGTSGKVIDGLLTSQTPKPGLELCIWEVCWTFLATRARKWNKLISP